MLIPSYNVEGYIAELINNAKRQTVPFEEIIVYDDDSKDETVSRAQNLGVPVIEGETNQGAAFARNRLLEKASSDFVHFHDADDVFVHPRFVEKLLPFADKNTAAFCWWKATNYDSDVVDEYTYPNEVEDWTRFFISQHVHLNAAVYPRKFVLEAGGFDESLRQQQDILFHIQLANAGLQYLCRDEFLARHDRSPDSTINKVTQATRDRWALEVCKRCGDLPERYHEAVAKKALYHTRRLVEMGDWKAARSGITVAREFGVTKIENRGRLVHLLSQVFGMETALRYQLWRT